MTRHHVAHALVITVAAAFVAAGCSSAGSGNPKDTSTLYPLKTSVVIARGATALYAPGRTGDKLHPGDRLHTDVSGHAEVDWPDKSLTRLGPDTTMRISPLARPDKRQVSVQLDVGKIWNRVQRITGSGGYDVRTPVAVDTVRGTRFAVACTAEPACAFEVVDGTVAVTPTGGATVLVTAGQTLTVKRGTPTPRPQTVGIDKLNADPFIAENMRLDALPSDQRSAALAPPTTTTTAATAPTTTVARSTTTRPNASQGRTRPSMIAFTRNGNVFALGTDGHIRQLTTTGLDAGPSISPNGTQIAFTRANPDRSPSAMWLMGADGSGAHVVTADLQEPFAWSPDSRRLAAAHLPGGGIGIIAASGGTVQLVPNADPTGNGVTWSPDGRSLAFRSQSGPNGGPSIKVVRTDGTGLRPLDTDIGAVYPSWSPDGRQVAFSEASPVAGHQSDVGLVAADGSAPAHVITIDRPNCSADLPAWTADSRQLVVQGNCQGAGLPDGVSGIWLLDSVTGHFTRLTSGSGYQSVSGSGPFIAER